jgi:hypothetical protein
MSCLKVNDPGKSGASRGRSSSFTVRCTAWCPVEPFSVTSSVTSVVRYWEAFRAATRRLTAFQPRRAQRSRRTAGMIAADQVQSHAKPCSCC